MRTHRSTYVVGLLFVRERRSKWTSGDGQKYEVKYRAEYKIGANRDVSPRELSSFDAHIRVNNAGRVRGLKYRVWLTMFVLYIGSLFEPVISLNEILYQVSLTQHVCFLLTIFISLELTAPPSSPPDKYSG